MSVDVLVTGADGFVGGSLMAACRTGALKSLGLSRKAAAPAMGETVLTDYTPQSIAAILARHAPKAVIHAAGSASVQDSIAAPHADFQSSVALLHNVLEGIRIWGGPTRLLFVSSAAVYGNPVRLPVSEDARAAPISPYGVHKLLCEELLRRHHELYGLPVIAARAFSLFGVRQKRLLLWELYKQLRDSKRVVLRGTGREERDYLDAATFSSLLLELLRRPVAGFTVLNVASGASQSVLDIIDVLQDIMGLSLPVDVAPVSRNGDPTAWRADVARLEAILDEPVRFDFARSLGRCVAGWDSLPGGGE